MKSGISDWLAHYTEKEFSNHASVRGERYPGRTKDTDGRP
jgi:hypothetical protein